MAGAGFTVTPTTHSDGTTGLVGHMSQFRLRWMAVRIHLLVYVQTVDTVTIDGLERFTLASMQRAIAAKGALRGLQVGVAVAPIQIGASVTDGARRYAQHQILLRHGAFAWPVAIDATSGEVHRHTGRPLAGWIYTKWMREQVDTVTIGR